MKKSVSLGEKLRKLRVERNLSQAELAEALFVKNTTISNWEHGKRQIHFDNLKLICVYFRVPLSYFSDEPQSGSTQIDHKKIPFQTIIAASAVVALVVSVGVVLLNQQTGLFIDACYGQQNCYLINDPALVSELESRNISGGLMTNVEMEYVYTHLENYLIDERTSMNQGLVGLLDSLNYPEPEMYYVLRMLYHNDPNGLPNYLFDLRSLNVDSGQYLLINNTKYIIYKIGPNRFKYEIYASRSYTLTIDLGMNAFYWNDFKFSPPLQIIDNFLNNSYPTHLAKLYDYDDFYLFEGLYTQYIDEPYFSGEFMSGSFGFYHLELKLFIVAYISLSYGPSYFNHEIMFQNRVGLYPARDLRFSFLNVFDSTYNLFPSFINEGNNISYPEEELYPNNDYTFLEDIIPYFYAVGSRPLNLSYSNSYVVN
jgi:transcriptional regulator with XRE-family HTH domain